MIDLHAKAVSDSQKIHNNNLGSGGFAVDLTFTDLSTVPQVQTIKGLYNDTALVGINIETNMPVRGSKIAISFHTSDLTIWDGLETSMQRWKVSFTNGAGNTVTVEVNDVIPDRSFGDTLLMCKVISRA